MKQFSRTVVHIGLHKTGTSALQALWHGERDSLARELGVLYPDVQVNHSQPLFSQFTEQPASYPVNIRSGIDSEEIAARANADYRERFEAAFDNSSADELLLSGEDLSDLSESGLHRLREWLAPRCTNITVLCLVRNPVAWAVSAAQSSIRGGMTYEELQQRPPALRLRQRLERACAVFGHEAVQVLDFDSARNHPKGLAGAVFTELGWPLSWLEGRETERRNESMSLEAAYLLSALNRERPLFVEGRLGETRGADDFRGIVDAVPGQRFALGTAVMEKLRRDSAEDLQWLRQRFGLQLEQEAAAAPFAEPPRDLLFSEAAISGAALEMHDKTRVQRNNARLTNRLRQLEERATGLDQLLQEKDQRLQELGATATRLQEQLHHTLDWKLRAPLRWWRRRRNKQP